MAPPRAGRARRLGGGSLRAERIATSPRAVFRAPARLNVRNRHHGIANPNRPAPDDVRPQPAPMHEPAESAGRRQLLEVRARLGETPAGALDLPDPEAAADEGVQPDAAG